MDEYCRETIQSFYWIYHAFCFWSHDAVYSRSTTCPRIYSVTPRKKIISNTPRLFQNTVHIIFLAEIVCLNFSFLNGVEYLYSKDFCFDSSISSDTHDSSPVIILFKNWSPLAVYLSRNVKALGNDWLSLTTTVHH